MTRETPEPWPPHGFGTLRPSDDGRDKMLAIKLPLTFQPHVIDVEATVVNPRPATLGQKIRAWLGRFRPL